MSPARSKNQLVAMIIAEKAKKGQASVKPNTPSSKMAKSMSVKQLNDFTGTPMKGLPKKVKSTKGSY